MKNYTITVNGNVYDVTVEETGSTSGAAAPRRTAAKPAAAPAAAAACPRYSVDLVSIRVAYTVVVLVPRLVCVRYIIQRSESILSVAVLREAQCRVVLARHRPHTALVAPLAGNDHIVTPLDSVGELLLTVVTALRRDFEVWRTFADEIAHIPGRIDHKLDIRSRLAL